MFSLSVFLKRMDYIIKFFQPLEQKDFNRFLEYFLENSCFGLLNFRFLRSFGQIDCLFE